MANVDFTGKVPKVGGASLPGVRVSPRAFGSQIGEALEAGGKEATNIFANELQDARAANARDLLNTANRKMRELGDGRAGGGHPGAPDQEDALEGFHNLQQGNALTQQEKYRGLIDKELDDILAQAPDEVVRSLMSSQISNLRNNTHSRLSTHSRKERLKYEDTVQKATITEGTQQAVSALNAGDVDGAIRSIRDIHAATKQYEMKNGAGEKAATSAAEVATTNAHVSAIQGLIDQRRFAEADAYYKKVTSDPTLLKGFDSTSRGVMEGRMRKGKEEQWSLDKADQIMADYQITAAAPGKGPAAAKKAAFAALKKIKDPVKRDATRKRVTAQLREQEAILDDRKQSIKADFYKHIGEGGDQFSFQNARPADFRLIAGELPLSIDATITRIREGKRHGKDPNNPTYKKWENVTDPRKWAKLDIESVRPEVTPKQAEIMKRNIDGAKATLKKLDLTTQANKSAETLLIKYAPSKLVPALKRNLKTGGTDNENAAIFLRLQVQGWVEQFKKAQQKDPTDAEITKFILDLTLKGEADPDNTAFGIPGIRPPRPGEESTAGFVFQVKRMSPQQREVFSVPTAEIRRYDELMLAANPNHVSLLQDIKDEIADAKMTETAALVEALAGAVVTGNTSRINRLLGRTGRLPNLHTVMHE